MPIELKCELCGAALGEVNKGKVRTGAVLLCKDCWPKVKIAHDIAEQAVRDVPDFLKNTFGGFRNR
jgi:ribosome-binding protein aMBF1 (putative translation factor)